MPETWPPDRRGKYAKTMRELDERIAALTLCLEKFAAEIEAKDAEIKRLTAQIEIDGKLIATLQAERDHWSGLVSRADHALFPFALEQNVKQERKK